MGAAVRDYCDVGVCETGLPTVEMRNPETGDTFNMCSFHADYFEDQEGYTEVVFDPDKYIPQVGDRVQGHFGPGEVVAIFDEEYVQVKYFDAEGTSSTEKVVGAFHTARG